MDDNNQNLQLDTTTPETGDTVAETIITIEGSIKSHMAHIERVKEEYKKQKEMLDSIFDSDPPFKEKSELAKAAIREKSAAKQLILKRADVAHLNQKVKDVHRQLKEFQEALSTYLAQYQLLTGSNQFEGDDGQLRQIVYVAKLVKRSEK